MDEKRGNVLPYGTDLIVQVKGAKSVNGRLLKKKGIGWEVIQIDQSGNRANPEPDKITFEMKEFNKFTKERRSMLPGKYMIQIACFGQPGSTSYHNKWRDEFEVV